MTITGGPVFWILIIMAVLAVIIYFERLMDFRRAQIDYDDFLKGVFNVLDSDNDVEALTICEDVAAPVANVVATAIRHRNGSARLLREAVDAQERVEIGRLDRRLASLAIIAQVAPLLGLLGTIIGFIRTVLALNAEAVVSRADLMNGAMESLVTAALGLVVMIPVIIMYESLRVRLRRAETDIAAAATQILNYIATSREEKKVSAK